MLATPKDFQASVVVVAVYAFFSIIGAPKSLMNSLLSQGLVVRGAWVVAILGLAYNHFYMTAVLLAFVGFRLSTDTRSSYVFSTESIMAQYSELQKNDPRFKGSMDAQLADGTLQLDPAARPCRSCCSPRRSTSSIWFSRIVRKTYSYLPTFN